MKFTGEKMIRICLQLKIFQIFSLLFLYNYVYHTFNFYAYSALLTAQHLKCYCHAATKKQIYKNRHLTEKSKSERVRALCEEKRFWVLTIYRIKCCWDCVGYWESEMFLLHNVFFLLNVLLKSSLKSLYILLWSLNIIH